MWRQTIYFSMVFGLTGAAHPADLYFGTVHHGGTTTVQLQLKNELRTFQRASRINRRLAENAWTRTEMQIGDNIRSQMGAKRARFTTIPYIDDVLAPQFDYRSVASDHRWTDVPWPDSYLARASVKFEYAAILLADQRTELTSNLLDHLEIKIKGSDDEWMGGDAIVVDSSELEVAQVGKDGLSVKFKPEVVEQIRHAARSREETLDTIFLTVAFVGARTHLSVEPTPDEQDRLLNRKFKNLLKSCVQRLAHYFAD